MATSKGVRAPLRTYKLRTGRVTAGQADARERLWPAYGVDMGSTPLDLQELFGRRAPVVLEIGFGMGEATAAMAAAQPELDVLAVDVHPPGQGALLRLLERDGLTNVRVAEGDALDVLRDMLSPASLSEVRLFFPDPWPKRRHWKRRLVGGEFVGLVAQRLVSGGLLHVATDWPHYAEQVRRVVAASPEFLLQEPDVTPWRATTRFERQGITAGRPALDVSARRR
jgi:tRNA (guanine-N7-)-methyltransferase